MRIISCFLVVLVACCAAIAQQPPAQTSAALAQPATPTSPATNLNAAAEKQFTLRDVRKLYLEPMGGVDSKGTPLQLEQYIKAELSARLGKRITVVTRKEDADAVMGGTGDWRNTSGAQLTGRYLGLHDTSTGAVSIEKDGVILWSTEAGDRSLFWGNVMRNGPRKVASRIVKHLDDALSQADATAQKGGAR